MNRLAAVILAAGKGTRFRSQLPKVLHPLSGVPMVHYPVSLAKAVGASPIVVVVGHGADLVRRSLEEHDDILFVDQVEQLGTGHAAQVGIEALPKSAERVLILSGDVPLLSEGTVRRLLEGSEDVRLLSTTLPEPSGYGRILRRGDGVEIIEERDAAPEQRTIREVNAGVYVLRTSFARPALAALRPNNAQHELYLTDVVRAAGPSVDVVSTSDAREVKGANHRGELAELQAWAWRRINASLMLEGVTMLSPDSTYIDASVAVGVDTVI
ncbi:MAG: NTP transferase domain-containing protein, partial [Myxococcales bacterium]|nr:NTP transferase domain-containing protein [Myxococcales bacterium]